MGPKRFGLSFPFGLFIFVFYLFSMSPRIFDVDEYPESWGGFRGMCVDQYLTGQILSLDSLTAQIQSSLPPHLPGVTVIVAEIASKRGRLSRLRCVNRQFNRRRAHYAVKVEDAEAQYKILRDELQKERER